VAKVQDLGREGVGTITLLAQVILLFSLAPPQAVRSRAMARVICEVSSGPRESERTAIVKDVLNRKHHLRVEEGFITAEGGRHYLPIGIVGRDEARGLALIELPHESDSGISRLWVRQSDLLGITEPVS
jgi:hypothetical protein